MPRSRISMHFCTTVEDSLPEKILRAAAIAEKRGVTCRHLTRGRVSDGNARIQGHTSIRRGPTTGDSCRSLTKKLKTAAVSSSRSSTLIVMSLAFHNASRSVSAAWCPTSNVVLQKMRGKINPVTICKALYYRSRIKDLRMLLLGIKKEYRNKGLTAFCSARRSRSQERRLCTR